MKETYEPYTPVPTPFIGEVGINSGKLYAGNKHCRKTQHYGREFKSLREAIAKAEKKGYTRILIRKYEGKRQVDWGEIILREGI